MSVQKDTLINYSDPSYCVSEKSNYIQLQQTSVTKRKTDFIIPINGEGPYTPGQKISFQIQPTGFVDWNSLRFEFLYNTVQNLSNPTTGAHRRFATCSGSLIRKITVKIGSVTILDTDDYNILLAFFNKRSWNFVGAFSNLQQLEAYQPIFVQCNVMNGVPINGTIANTYLMFNTVLGYSPQPFSHRFALGFFAVLQYFPAHLVQQFVIEINLDPDISRPFFVAMPAGAPGNSFGAPPATGPYETWTINFCKLYYDTVDMDPGFMESIRVKAAANELYIPFLEMRRHLFTIPPAQSGYTGRISDKLGSLRSVIFIPMYINDYAPANAPPTYTVQSIERHGFGNAGDIGTATSDGYIIPTFFQMKIGGIYYPSYPMTTPVEMYQQVEMATGNYRLHKAGGVTNLYFYGFEAGELNTELVDPRSTSFYGDNYYWSVALGYDFDRENCPDMITGVNTIMNQTDIEFTMNFSNVIANQTTLMAFTLFDSTLRIFGSGQVQVLR
jgi:hypothetical protein